MRCYLLATLAAASIALSPAGAAPARADGGAELLGLLLGVGTVYAIGKGIERARAPAGATVEEVAGRRDEFEALAPGYRFSMPRRVVPRDCLSTFETRHGELRGFDAACLARTMRRPDRLPAFCAVDTMVRDRDARIYAARCLQLEGWEIGHGRRAFGGVE